MSEKEGKYRYDFDSVESKRFRRLRDDIVQHEYDNNKAIFGKIATVIDAVIVDPDQKKSIKDLISTAIYSHTDYQNPERTLFAQYADVLDIETYKHDGDEPTSKSYVAWNRFEDIK